MFLFGNFGDKASITIGGICSPSSGFQWCQNASRGSPCDSMASCSYLLWFLYSIAMLAIRWHIMTLLLRRYLRLVMVSFLFSSLSSLNIFLKIWEKLNEQYCHYLQMSLINHFQNDFFLCWEKVSNEVFHVFCNIFHCRYWTETWMWLFSSTLNETCFNIHCWWANSFNTSVSSQNFLLCFLS